MTPLTEKTLSGWRARAALNGVQLITGADGKSLEIVAVMPDRSLRRINSIEDMESLLVRREGTT